ncbi:flagella basal body P-ring formation protein FlgA (plasmid) [Rossellomorea sp. AcN35-11]|nr:flagella basal body P-ring formation protein FlgA [Rossellomorea aquimaris]WJV32201.1 flagella basal body P-ring formation protein FlgA [Rossellomorea sp. AcN35-11]
MKPGLKIAIGIFMALVSMSFVVVYDVYVKDKIDSVEVVTVKAGQVIEKNEVIELSKISVQRREKSGLIDGVFTADRIKEIIGVEASQTMVGNSMISEKMLDRDALIPNEEEGEAIRPIIAEWIYAAPGSLRRKDTIDVYLIKNEDNKTQANVVASKEEEISKLKDVKGPVLKDVQVIYAKDPSNKEVIGGEGARGDDKRLDASAQIADIEVILNEDDFTALADYVIKEGYKLYITYN